jgi:predicted nuclease of predicted toxin-antitoxin system
VNFLVDAQLPPALARWISSQGHHATHIFDIGLQAADDTVIWERARSDKTVIISKDEDFVDHRFLAPRRCNWCGFAKGIVQTRRCSTGSNRFGPVS